MYKNKAFHIPSQQNVEDNKRDRQKEKSTVNGGTAGGSYQCLLKSILKFMFIKEQVQRRVSPEALSTSPRRQDPCSVSSFARPYFTQHPRRI